VCSRVQANIGDRIIVNLNNKLGNETTSLHFHGIFQTGSTAMDGPTGVTQCPIAPGATFTYDFVVSSSLILQAGDQLTHSQVNQPGSYWYHSHNKGQYIDGLRGSLIIHDPAAPFKFDEEITLTVSDVRMTHFFCFAMISNFFFHSHCSKKHPFEFAS
jgi:iron transport multicopper oxidase